MKTKIRSLHWLLLLILLAGSAGAWAQTNTSPTQIVCIGNEPYKVDPSPLPNPTYTWSITGGSTPVDWQINGTGTDITVDWKTAGTYTLSVFTTAGGCPGPVQSVIVTVKPLPLALATPSTQNVCSNVAIADIVLSTSNNLTGICERTMENSSRNSHQRPQLLVGSLTPPLQTH